MELVHLFYRANLFTLLRNRFICMHHCWNLCWFCWNFFASFVFWCYKACKNGKYFIYPEGKIFGVRIKCVKIRRAMAYCQSGNQKRFTKERNTLMMNIPGGSLGLEASNSNLPYRSSREGNGNPVQDSCLENFMDRGGWQATVHRITKNQAWQSDYTYLLLLSCFSRVRVCVTP